MSKLKVIKKVLKTKCWSCNGRGCKVCKSIGIHEDKYYILIHDGYAIDGDTLK